MPIEINEIAIQMKVRDEANGTSGGTAKAADAAASCGDSLSPAEREAVVADCVARVLRALQAQRER